MTDAQLYLAIGVPVFAVMVGIVAGILQMNSMGGHFTSMEARFTSLETSLNARFTSLEARFETLIGKVVEIDNRLTRVRGDSRTALAASPRVLPRTQPVLYFKCGTARSRAHPNIMSTAAETMAFQAETKELLRLMIHSLYTDKDIFLRELISNASDAIDRLRFEALTNADLAAVDDQSPIRLEPDSEARTLIVSDNGIGMTRDEVIANIGTIAEVGHERTAARA